jgi:hypothetical protein
LRQVGKQVVVEVEVVVVRGMERKNWRLGALILISRGAHSRCANSAVKAKGKSLNIVGRLSEGKRAPRALSCHRGNLGNLGREGSNHTTMSHCEFHAHLYYTPFP